ncbi:hypothetical protein NDU88_001648 [Pleurodeles waltl]|uniref:Reverse transcriptase domain-containing protein n=1 Tax=Pleurodeles waltl TaxID=8319 RepID=A0AAV7T0Y4_PLEWA|nr:hypothetical protein NDU88_001648 [Pleurodeles waltl]
MALVRDTIEYIKSRKVQAALVSLDQEKAFNCFSHEFMDQTLRALGLCDFFATNRLVVGTKEASTLACRKMILSLLRDYAALDGLDDNSNDEASRPKGVPSVPLHRGAWRDH